MTKNERKTIIAGMKDRGEWIDIGRHTVTLDGDFSAEELRAIADELDSLTEK
jgi:hypothetical protein